MYSHKKIHLFNVIHQRLAGGVSGRIVVVAVIVLAALLLDDPFHEVKESIAVLYSWNCGNGASRGR